MHGTGDTIVCILAGRRSGADMAVDSGTIGWIGIGRMGFELAARLLDKGFDVAVWNRTRSKAEPLAEMGATIVDGPSDLAVCDIVVTMVSSSDVFELVTVGDGGVLTREG